MKIHIVQKGDTLWKIAKKYGVNFEELKKLNSQLSNPDMIMPGMKVKVPTTGGLIKKESPMGTKPGNAISPGTKKEVPIAEHPFAKEKPKPLPVKEVPIKEKPIVKEAPKTPYIPKMPISVAPEIDINNYYVTNMANMNVQPPQPKPQPPLPPVPEVKEAPKKEVPVMPVVEAPVECPPPVLEQPICEPECVPITPVMPGTGFGPPLGYPIEPAVPYPTQSGAVPIMSGSVPYPVDPGVSYVPPHFEDESSSSYFPQIPMTSPVPFHGEMVSGANVPVQPHYSQSGAVQGGQIPAGYPSGMSAEYSQGPTGYPAAPQYPSGGYPGYPAAPQYPSGGYPGYPAAPAGYPQGGYPGYPAGPAGYSPGGYPGYPAGPAGYPSGGYPGYGAASPGYPPTAYGAYSEPGPYPRIPSEYGQNLDIVGSENLNLANPANGSQPIMPPYGPMPYGYPQMSSVSQPAGSGDFETFGHTGGIPADTDCGCNEVPAAEQSFVPTTPPVYMAPYTAPGHLAQPPFMNPYGIGPAEDGNAYMPRNKEEGTEYND